MVLIKIKCLAIIFVSVVTTNTMAQDLIARQAPLDKKMRAVDSVALQRQIRAEQIAYPSYNLYPSWNNDLVNAYGNVALPDTFRIDMRGFSMPTPSRVITSRFGPRWGRMHKGLDIKVYIGDTICAAFEGRVRVVKYERRGYGNYIVVRHNNGLETIYGHLSKQLVHEDQYVRAGEPIGLGGNTGRSTGSHLHFETRLLGQAINPELLFNFPDQDVTCDTYVFRNYGRNVSFASLASLSDRFKKNSEVEEESVIEEASAAKYYKIHKGETLSSIAEKNGVTIEELCKLNRITRKTKLRVGQVLKCS